MDRICGILERHERWVETLEPSGDDALKRQHWNVIIEQIRANLELHEMLANNYKLYQDAGIDKEATERMEQLAKSTHNGYGNHGRLPNGM